MKVRLDLDQLLEQNRITRDEYARLAAMAARDTASLGLNILVAFGVIAVAAATIALLKSASAATALGAAIAAAGLWADRSSPRDWQPLGIILLLVGCLMAGGGLVSLTEGSPAAFGALAIVFGAVSLVARSGLLAALSALALFAASGGRSGYEHALYWLGVEQPLVTVVLFGALAVAAHRVSLAVGADRGRLAIVFGRTCLFLANFGFWIGSLWGDPLRIGGWHAGSWEPVIPAGVFAFAWAFALVAAAVWGVRHNRRTVVNIAAVFGAIHFYTQYFERLGATPGSILTAGLLALAIAFTLIRYNRTAPSPTVGS